MTKELNRILFIFIIINIIDIVNTYILLNNGGVELNPLMNYTMNKLGTLQGMLLIKGIFITGIILLTSSKKFMKRYYDSTIKCLKLITIVMVMIIVSFNITGLIYIWWFGSSVG